MRAIDVLFLVLFDSSIFCLQNGCTEQAGPCTKRKAYFSCYVFFSFALKYFPFAQGKRDLATKEQSFFFMVRGYRGFWRGIGSFGGGKEVEDTKSTETHKTRVVRPFFLCL
jgi:hypothetical protein